MEGWDRKAWAYVVGCDVRLMSLQERSFSVVEETKPLQNGRKLYNLTRYRARAKLDQSQIFKREMVRISDSATPGQTW